MEVQIFFPAYTTPFIYKFILLEKPIVAVLPTPENDRFAIECTESLHWNSYVIKDSREITTAKTDAVMAVLIRGARMTNRQINTTIAFVKSKYGDARIILDIGGNDQLGKTIRDKKLEVYTPNDTHTIKSILIELAVKFCPTSDPYYNQAD